MVDDDRLRAAAARCLYVLLHYQHGERTDAAKAEMVAEIEEVAGRLLGSGLPPASIEDGVLRPVEEYLTARCGHELGLRINAEFVEAFEGAKFGPTAA